MRGDGDGDGDGLFQAIKQKLHMRSRLTEEPPVTDVQEEQDKAKMLLGAKLLVSGGGGVGGGGLLSVHVCPCLCGCLGGREGICCQYMCVHSCVGV